MTIRNNPHWLMFTHDNMLFITRGADEIYMVDSAVQHVDAVQSAYEREAYSELDMSDPEIAAVMQEIEQAGVIYRGQIPRQQTLEKMSLYVKYYGKQDENLGAMLGQFIENHQDIVLGTEMDSADLVLLVRQSGEMLTLLEGYAEITKPHLLVDTAFEHTLSIGPLVYPGETACINCFAGRIIQSWGNTASPKKPNAAEHTELIAALILEHLKTYLKLGSCPELVNQAWTMNLNDFSTKVDNVHKLPWCETCFPDGQEQGIGSFELSWRL